ncbi:NADP-dependent oxidoreductase [Streptomyces olivoverticillatus]
MNETALTVHQTARPHGFPTADHFTFVESPIPGPAVGSALVENLYWSVDPYHREMMDDVPGGFALGAPLEGRTIGRVIASRTPGLAEGEIVFHRQGWRTHAVVTPEEIRKLPRFDGVPLTAYLSILGGTGLTAYVGLTRIARLQEGEDLFVSAAAGGVGTATGRFARLLGAGRLVGSAGSAAKADHLTREVGYDAVFDYHDGPAADLLGKVAPDGIDVFVDNVGGQQLAAAVGALREFGRIVRIGTISQYNTPRRTAAALQLLGHRGEKASAWRASWSATTAMCRRSCTSSRYRICRAASSLWTRQWLTGSSTSWTHSWECCTARTPARSSCETARKSRP